MRLLTCAAMLALATAASPAAAQVATPADVTAADVTAADAAALDDAAPAPTATPGDPFERVNRAVWGLNRGVDKAIVRPVTVAYRFVTPRPARRGIAKIFANLGEPWSFINNLLQGKPGRAMNNLGRFVVNTTVGVGGLADHATDLGLKPTPEDFGQTLARWGVKDSAYLVLPLLGPSTVRDGIGSGVAMFADPYNICLSDCTGLSGTQQLGVQAGNVISIRSDLIDSGADAFLDSSLDSYATARSAFFQNRAAAIADTEGEDASAAEPSPDVLDPAIADAPPPETPDGPADPGVTAPPADAGSPKLSFNITNLEG